jgi:hypothetical protein
MLTLSEEIFEDGGDAMGIKIHRIGLSQIVIRAYPLMSFGNNTRYEAM